MGIRLTIPMKLPSCNEYINACRTNYHAGNNLKKQVEDNIIWYLKGLPKFEHPIKINFIWIDKNKKRDLDGICFAKKFILDAMQKCGKLENDNRKWVTGFTDSFAIGDDYKVILEIEEVET